MLRILRFSSLAAAVLAFSPQPGRLGRRTNLPRLSSSDPNQMPTDARFRGAIQPEFSAAQLEKQADVVSVDQAVAASETTFRSLREMLDFVLRMGGDGVVPPHVLQRYSESLLHGRAYEYVVRERRASLSKAAQTGDDQESEMAIRQLEQLDRVEAFLSGYLAAERRRRSKATFEAVLQASMQGPMAFDEKLSSLRKEGALDTFLDDYLDEVAGKVSGIRALEKDNSGGSPLAASPLLKVVKIVKDRVQVEKDAGGSPLIKIFAQCLAIRDAVIRRELLQDSVGSLDVAVELIDLVEASIDYLRGSEAKRRGSEENYDEVDQETIDIANEALREVLGQEEAQGPRRSVEERIESLQGIIADIEAVVKQQAPEADLEKLRGL